MSDSVDQELLDDFIFESLHGLQEIERDLLSLESHGTQDDELINRIFRTVHSMKGAGGYLGLDRLVDVAHLAETLLDRVRKHTCDVTPNVADAVLASCDTLSLMLQEEGVGQAYDATEVLTKLNACLTEDGNTSTESKPTASAAETESETAAIETAIANCPGPETLYQVQANLGVLHELIDAKEGILEVLNSVGKVVHASIPIDEIDRQLKGDVTIYYQTIMDPELLHAHLGIPVDQIQLISENPKKALADTKTREETPSQNPDTSSDPSPSETKPPKLAPEPTPAPPAKEARKAKPSQSTGSSSQDQMMRVPVRILNELLEWTGNMVMARNQLLSSYDFSGDAAFRTLSAAITGVHETVIATRMQTTGSLFDRYRRVVRDLSRKLSKEVDLVIEGGDLELDRTILESFADPLTHLLRNSLDHGIETPAERETAGKNRQAQLTLRSYQQSGEIILEVEDDGKGIDPETIAKLAVKKGVVQESDLAAMPAQQKLELIFQPGFSTKEEASDLSGRGVGMDVVKTNIENVGGTLDIKSTPGTGTTISTHLPLAKALVSSSLTAALIIRVGSEWFSIPQTAVSEILDQDDEAESAIEVVDGQYVFHLRDDLIPVIDLHGECSLTPNQSAFANRGQVPQGPMEIGNQSLEKCLVLLTHRRHVFALMVDEVLGFQEIIVRSLPQLIKSCPLFSGMTVLGDGRVAMILDVNGVVKTLDLKFIESESSSENKQDYTGVEEDEQAQRMLIFNYAPDEYFAIPLELVSIIERFNVSDIQRVGESEYFQFKNETISILRLSNFLPISQEPFEETECCLIRPSTIDYPIGILTGPDVTIAEVSATFESRIDDKNGVIGTFSHNDHLVMLLDLYAVFENHAPDKLRAEPVISGEANILVVEDSMFFRKLIAQYASHDDWNMTIVNDGVEAWKLLRDKQQNFDLIISDINMPRMDGFELVSRIRKEPRFDETPVIALTTLSQDSYRKKGLDLGFDRYVVKINKHEIVQTISECLQIRRGVAVE